MSTGWRCRLYARKSDAVERVGMETGTWVQILCTLCFMYAQIIYNSIGTSLSRRAGKRSSKSELMNKAKVATIEALVAQR